MLSTTQFYERFIVIPRDCTGTFEFLSEIDSGRYRAYGRTTTITVGNKVAIFLYRTEENEEQIKTIRDMAVEMGMPFKVVRLKDEF